jgi:hypothetical protein
MAGRITVLHRCLWEFPESLNIMLHGKDELRLQRIKIAKTGDYLDYPWGLKIITSGFFTVEEGFTTVSV